MKAAGINSSLRASLSDRIADLVVGADEDAEFVAQYHEVERAYLKDPELASMYRDMKAAQVPDKLLLRDHDVKDMSVMAHDCGLLGSNADDFYNYMAMELQSALRGWLARRSFLLLRGAAILIQHHWRVYYYAKLSEQERLDEAARRIGRRWRRFRDRRLYFFYRDMIVDRERGDPGVLLRSINPREAALADAAAGTYVRFRLGGQSFPPLIFYKIFTDRPVADIGSFAPRYYAEEPDDERRARLNRFCESKHQGRERPNSARAASKEQQWGTKGKSALGYEVKFADVHNTYDEDEERNLNQQLAEFVRPNGSIGQRKLHHWYRRVENNGWRPIADRVLLEVEEEERRREQARFIHYQHLPKLRKEDKIRRAKAKKREWFRKMYQLTDLSAFAQAKRDYEDQWRSMQPSPPYTPEQRGVLSKVAPEPNKWGFSVDKGSKVEEEDDSMLAWVAGLDFEEYAREWTELAASDVAELDIVDAKRTAALPYAPPLMNEGPHHNLTGVYLAPMDKGKSRSSLAPSSSYEQSGDVGTQESEGQWMDEAMAREMEALAMMEEMNSASRVYRQPSEVPKKFNPYCPPLYDPPPEPLDRQTVRDIGVLMKRSTVVQFKKEQEEIRNVAAQKNMRGVEKQDSGSLFDHLSSSASGLSLGASVVENGSSPRKPPIKATAERSGMAAHLHSLAPPEAMRGWSRDDGRNVGRPKPRDDGFDYFDKHAKRGGGYRIATLTGASTLMSDEEERDLEDLMELFDTSVSSLGTFKQRLQAELEALEIANVYATLEGGDLAKHVNDTLLASRSNLDDLEEWLSIFNVKLKHMQGDVTAIEAWSNLLEVHQQNHRKLLARLTELLTICTIDRRCREIILQGNFFHIEETAAAASQLASAIEQITSPDLEHLREVHFLKEFRDSLFADRQTFSARALDFFRREIFTIKQQILESLRSRTGDLSKGYADEMGYASRENGSSWRVILRSVSIGIRPLIDHLSPFRPLLQMLGILDPGAHRSVEEFYCSSVNELFKRFLVLLSHGLRVTSHQEPTPGDYASRNQIFIDQDCFAVATELMSTPQSLQLSENQGMSVPRNIFSAIPLGWMLHDALQVLLPRMTEACTGALKLFSASQDEGGGAKSALSPPRAVPAGDLRVLSALVDGLGKDLEALMQNTVSGVTDHDEVGVTRKCRFIVEGQGRRYIVLTKTVEECESLRHHLRKAAVECHVVHPRVSHAERERINGRFTAHTRHKVALLTSMSQQAVELTDAILRNLLETWATPVAGGSGRPADHR